MQVTTGLRRRVPRHGPCWAGRRRKSATRAAECPELEGSGGRHLGHAGPDLQAASETAQRTNGFHSMKRKRVLRLSPPGPGCNTSQSPRLCWGRRPALKAPPKAPFRKFWLICPLKLLKMLEKGSNFFAPSARFVGVVVRPGQMGLRPEVIRYPKKGQFSYLGVNVGLVLTNAEGR